jgi:hypothetical protein
MNDDGDDEYDYKYNGDDGHDYDNDNDDMNDIKTMHTDQYST